MYFLETVVHKYLTIYLCIIDIYFNLKYVELLKRESRTMFPKQVYNFRRLWYGILFKMIQ